MLVFFVGIILLLVVGRWGNLVRKAREHFRHAITQVGKTRRLVFVILFCLVAFAIRFLFGLVAFRLCHGLFLYRFFLLHRALLRGAVPFWLVVFVFVGIVFVIGARLLLFGRRDNGITDTREETSNASTKAFFFLVLVVLVFFLVPVVCRQLGSGLLVCVVIVSIAFGVVRILVFCVLALIDDLNKLGIQNLELVFGLRRGFYRRVLYRLGNSGLFNGFGLFNNFGLDCFDGGRRLFNCNLDRLFLAEIEFRLKRQDLALRTNRWECRGRRRGRLLRLGGNRRFYRCFCRNHHRLGSRRRFHRCLRRNHRLGGRSGRREAFTHLA